MFCFFSLLKFGWLGNFKWLLWLMFYFYWTFLLLVGWIEDRCGEQNSVVLKRSVVINTCLE